MKEITVYIPSGDIATYRIGRAGVKSIEVYPSDKEVRIIHEDKIHTYVGMPWILVDFDVKKK